MTKSDYENILLQANKALTEIHSLDALLNGDDPIYSEVLDAQQNILNVKDWATNEIELINQEVVINSFLSELKVVFDKYNAVMEIGSSESGYGQSYGEGGTTGVKFTASLNSVLGSKVIDKNVIDKNVIVGEDLV